jgi:hypothetical protein
MQIFVCTPDGRTITCDVQMSDTIELLQEKIFNKLQIIPDDQRLSFGGKELVSGNKLDDYNIQQESTIFLSLRLKGG